MYNNVLYINVYIINEIYKRTRVIGKGMHEGCGIYTLYIFKGSNKQSQFISIQFPPSLPQSNIYSLLVCAYILTLYMHYMLLYRIVIRVLNIIFYFLFYKRPLIPYGRFRARVSNEL